MATVGGARATQMGMLNTAWAAHSTFDTTGLSGADLAQLELIARAGFASHAAAVASQGKNIDGAFLEQYIAQSGLVAEWS